MPPSLDRPTAGERALQRVVNEIRDGLRHGYFDLAVSCEVIGQGRRRLQVRAGKHYQFVIPADECGPSETSSDLRHEGAVDPQS